MSFGGYELHCKDSMKNAWLEASGGVPHEVGGLTHEMGIWVCFPRFS